MRLLRLGLGAEEQPRLAVVVAEGLFKPLAAEWTRFSLTPTEFIAEDERVVSLGDFEGLHGVTGKTSRARYAHVWTVRNGKIARFRQYIDTLAVAEARRP